MPAPNPIRRRRPVHLGLDATNYLPFEHSSTGSQSADSAAARTADAMTKGVGIRILAGAIGFVVVLLLRLFVIQDKTLPLECLLTLLTFVLPAGGTCGRLGSAETMLFFVATTFALRDVDMRTREMIAQGLVVDFLLWKMRLRVWLIFLLSVVILGGQFAIPVFLSGGTAALLQTPPRDLYWQLVVQFTLAIHAAWFVRSNGFLSELRNSTVSIGSELVRRWMKFALATPVLRFVVPILGSLFLSPIRFLGRGIFSMKWMLAAALWGFLMQVEWSAQISVGGLAVATTLLLRLRASFFNLSQLKAQASFLIAAVVFNTIVYLAIPRKSLPFLANSIVSAYFILFVSFTRPNPTTGVRTPTHGSTSGGGNVQVLIEPPFSNISTVVLMLVWFSTLALDFFKQRELGWPEPGMFRTGLSLTTIGYGLLLLVSIFFDLVEQQLKLQPTSNQAGVEYSSHQGTGKKNTVEGSEGYAAVNGGHRQTDSSEPEVSQPQKTVGKVKKSHDSKQGAHAQQEDGGEVVAPSNSTTPPSDPPTHGDADSQASDDSSNHHRSSGNLAGSTENAENGNPTTGVAAHPHPTNGSIATEGDHESVPSASLGSAPGGNASATSMGGAGKEGGGDSAPTSSPSNAAAGKGGSKKSKAELEKERKLWQEQQLQSVLEEEDDTKKRAKKAQEEKRKQELAKEAAAKLAKEKEDAERKEKERKASEEKTKRDKEKELQAKKEKEEAERRQKEGELAAKKQKDRDSRIAAEKEGRRKVEEDEAAERGKLFTLAAKGKEERLAAEKQRASAEKVSGTKSAARQSSTTASANPTQTKSPATERLPATAAAAPEASGPKSDSQAASAAQLSKVRAAPAAICSVDDDLQLDQSAPLGATPPALQSPNLSNANGPKVPLPRSRQSNKPGGGLGSPVVASERPVGPGVPLAVDDSPFDEPLPPALGLGVISTQHSGSGNALKSPRAGTGAGSAGPLSSPRPSAAPASVDKSPSTTSKHAGREKVSAAEKETKKEPHTASGFAKSFPPAQAAATTTQPQPADRAPAAAATSHPTTSPSPAGATAAPPSTTPPSIGPLVQSSSMNSTPTPPTPPISGVSPTGNIQDQIPNFISLLTGPNSGSGAGFGGLTSGSGHSPQDPFATAALGLPLMSSGQSSAIGKSSATTKLPVSVGGDDGDTAAPAIHSSAGAGHGNGTSQDADFDSMWADVKSLLRDEEDDEVVLTGNLMSQPMGMTSVMATGKPLLAIPSPLNPQAQSAAPAQVQVQVQPVGLPVGTVNSNPSSAPNSPPKVYAGSASASPMSQGSTAAVPQTVQLQQLAAMNALPQVQGGAGAPMAYSAQATAAPPGYQLVQFQGPGGIPQYAYVYLPGYQTAAVPSGQYYSAPQAPAPTNQAPGQPQYVMVMPSYSYPPQPHQ